MEIVQSIEALSSTKGFLNKAGPVQDILNDSLRGEEDTHRLAYCKLVPTLEAPLRNNSISILTDHLILTSAAFVNSGIVDAAGVTCVISAAPELPLVPLSENVTFHRVDILDCFDSNISKYFDDVSDLIEQVTSSGNRVLIYCVAGVSRSATLCIVYLMKHRHLSLLEAYNYVKSRRPRIKPNCGFFKQLIQYERELYGKSTVRMVYNEYVQMSIPDVYEGQYRKIHIPTRRFRDKCKNGCRFV